jgi:DNA-binding Lrp family transcriptional regulator
MQCFFIQFKCKLGKAYQVAAGLAELEIASEVYSTSGEYDLLAKFYVENETDIGHFVNENVHPIEGVERTLTTLTFKAF